MNIDEKWDSLDEEYKLAVLEELETSKLLAFTMLKNIFNYPHTEIIGLLVRLSKEWGLNTRRYL
jgi:hypothetical protein